MLWNITIGTAMMAITTAIHAVGMLIAVRVVGRLALRPRPSMAWPLMLVTGTVLLFFVVSLVEVVVWAAAYLQVKAISGAEPALYFSMVTFTTLGYGDVVLDEQWRLLAPFEAANGIIMFGWTTALVIAVVQRVYRHVLRGAAGSTVANAGLGAAGRQTRS